MRRLSVGAVHAFSTHLVENQTVQSRPKEFYFYAILLELRLPDGTGCVQT